MKVILLEKIRSLGELGDEVQVKPGFGRNFLIPQNKAVPANAENRAYFNARRVELEKAVADRLAEAKARADKLKDVSLTMTMRASDEGKLYGSVTAVEIVHELEKQNIELNKADISMPTGPIRVVGQYDIAIHLLHGEVTTSITVNVTPEE